MNNAANANVNVDPTALLSEERSFAGSTLAEEDQMNNAANARVSVENSLMSTWSEGPAVSLNGSPTVSPVTAAWCAGLRLPPCAPVSMYFLALYQAPPEL